MPELVDEAQEVGGGTFAVACLLELAGEVREMAESTAAQSKAGAGDQVRRRATLGGTLAVPGAGGMFGEDKEEMPIIREKGGAKGAS